MILTLSDTPLNERQKAIIELMAAALRNANVNPVDERQVGYVFDNIVEVVDRLETK